MSFQTKKKQKDKNCTRPNLPPFLSFHLRIVFKNPILGMGEGHQQVSSITLYEK